MEKRIIVAGSGGQGILFFGKLMAYAAMLQGKEATWFPSYGAEIRGGTANCTVIISDEMIGSPVTRNPDILSVMNEASYNRFHEKLLTGGLLVYDASLIHLNGRRSDISFLKVPASELAASMKKPKSANMVMMGAFIAHTGILNLKTVLRAIEEITPARRKDSIAVNKELIAKGYGLIENKKNHSG